MISPTKAVPSSVSDYQLLGDSGLRVSPLCLGTMNFGDAWGTGAGKEDSEKIFRGYAEAGGNFIDTADRYTDGQSETYLGEFIKNHGERDRFVLATKYSLVRREHDPNACGNHRKSMVTALENSLKRLRVETIDLYWLHIWDFTTPTDEVIRAFDDLVKAGKIHYVAVSDTPAWKIAELHTYAKCHALTRPIATQVEYSLITRDIERDIAPMCTELGLGLLPWSPLKGGVLSGKYGRAELEAVEKGDQQGVGTRGMKWNEERVRLIEGLQKIADVHHKTVAQVALNWLLSRQYVPSVITGPRTLEHLTSSYGALGFDLTAEQHAEIERLAPITLGFPHDFLRQGIARQFVTADLDLPKRPYGQLHPAD
ncbi:MAG: aldo/keto reductase [Planctomycetota bacterium]